MSEFRLHPTLAADTLSVTTLALSQVLLMNDERYPWLIIVPQRPALTELYQLKSGDRQQLMRELDAASQVLHTQPLMSKINVASLGNLVPQLHVHVVGRHAADPAWPGPVWGHSAPVPYAPGEGVERARRLGEEILGRLAKRDR
ncbi:MAG: HIT domain-containing protein [Pseudomonadales bacterium]